MSQKLDPATMQIIRQILSDVIDNREPPKGFEPTSPEERKQERNIRLAVSVINFMLLVYLITSQA